jgi:hypothetical protein
MQCKSGAREELDRIESSLVPRGPWYMTRKRKDTDGVQQ